MLSRIPLKFGTGIRYVRIFSGTTRILPTSREFHLSTKALYSSFDKDFPIPTQLTPVDKLYSHDTDILLEQLKKAGTIERVLELVSMHLVVMNDKHLNESFNSINHIIRMIENDLDKQKELRDNPTFQSLCSQLMNRVRYLEPSNVINAFKMLTYLNVSANSYVMQSLLKMLCSQVNDLDLKQLTFLNFLLIKHRPSPLVDSLKLALPLVLQVQIDQQLDSDNLNEVVSCLRMASRARLKVATIQKVLSCLHSKVPELTPEQACTVAFSLLTLETPVDGYMQLLRAAFDIIANSIQHPSRISLLSLTRMCRRKSFYFRSFFTRLSKRAIAEHWDFEDCYELMKYLCTLNFFSSELLDVVAEGVCNNEMLVKQHEKYSLLTLSECFSMTDYHPPNIESVLDILSSPSNKFSVMLNTNPHLFLKMVSCWAIMGYFQSDCIHNILNENFLYPCLSNSRKIGREHEFEECLCYIHWALEVYDQKQKFAMPEEFMQRVFSSLQQKRMKSLDLPLTKFLENGLGGTQFFLNGVFTRNGHFIDHILAMRSGNYPISLNQVDDKLPSNQIEYVEDITVPGDTKIIAVLVANEEHYCTDPEVLKGYMSLRVKNLFKMSLCPVVVNYSKWMEMPDREKIPFLMREIKEANATDVSKSSLLPS